VEEIRGGYITRRREEVDISRGERSTCLRGVEQSLYVMAAKASTASTRPAGEPIQIEESIKTSNSIPNVSPTPVNYF
jgi:hypothetical protein